MKKIIQITFLLISLLIGGYWIVSEMTEKNNIEYILKEQGIFGKAFFYNLKDEVPEEALKTEVYQHAENVKGEMQIVLDDSEEFPEGLIWQIEEALYDSFTHVNENYSTDGNKNKQYFGLLSKLGGEHFLLKLDDMYKLFPKLQENEIELNDIYEAYHLVYGTESCLAMFRYTSTEQEDVYVTVVDNGGSNGSATVYINNLIDGNFVVRYMFEVQNFGNGCVIQYEEEFYYIYLHYNYNLKNYDGVQILKLGEKELEGNIMVKYLPKVYFWKNIYLAKSDYKQTIEQYVDSIKDMIVSNEYLENGKSGEISVLVGNEETAVEVNSNEGTNIYYMVDLANIGTPIYIEKTNLIPSSYHDTWHLCMKCYWWNEATETMKELTNFEISENSLHNLEIVQLWFKKLDGLVFSFRVSHIYDYNYMLDVFLIEGNKITHIRKDIFSPQREFVLYEGKDKIM